MWIINSPLRVLTVIAKIFYNEILFLILKDPKSFLNGLNLLINFVAD